jgi:hypothetical protein
MELQHVVAKLFLDGELTVDPERFIETFHRWIREATVEGLLLDVADYRHVPAGPGVMLIGQAGDYAMDHADNRWGMLYNHKSGLDGTNADRFRHSLRAAAMACELFETEFEGLKFCRQQLQLQINDRALASNTADNRAAFADDVTTFLTATLGHANFEIEPEAEPRRRLGVTVKSSQPFELAVF